MELHQHRPELCLPRLSGIVAIDRGLYHRVGMRAGPRVPVHGGPRTPALPSFLPSPISISKKGRKHVTTSGCRPTGRFSTWQEPRCGTVSGDSTSCSSTGTGFTCKVPFPPTPRYRTASTSGGSLPCSPATWVCSVHIAWQQPKQERWVTPHPLPPSPTHHYDDCPVVPANWGRVGQSPKPPVTRRGKPRHWAPRGANPMSPLLVPDPRAPSGVVWRHVRHTSGPALTTHQPWRAGQVSPILIVSLTSRSKRQMQRNEGQN